MNNPRNSTLSHRVAAAGSLSIICKFAGRGFDLVTLVILSRLLSPADFGLTAMAMTAVTLAEAVTQLPLAQVLVRVAEPAKEMYDTAFTLAFLRGVILAVILGSLAVALSAIYHEPRLTALISTLSLAPIFRGTLSPRMVIYMRQMDYRREAGIEVAGKAVALAVSSGLALTTHSYWAIAAATISTPLVMNILSYVFAPYVPRLDFSHWTIFRSMVGWNSVSQLITAMNWQMDRLLLGYFVPKSSLGRYTMATDLSGIPVQAIVMPLGSPLLAAYSIRGEEHPSVLVSTYLKSSNAVLAIGGPVFLGLSLLAKPIVLLVLGPAWSETGAWLEWIALLNIIVLPVYHVGGLALSLNQPRMMAWRTLGEFVVAMPALLIGSTYFGAPGVIAAKALTALVILAVSMKAVRSLVACSIGSQLMALHRTTLALLALAAAVGSLRPLVASQSTPALGLSLAAVSAVGAVVYMTTLYCLWIIEGRPGGIEKVVLEKAVSFLKRIRKGRKSSSG